MTSPTPSEPQLTEDDLGAAPAPPFTRDDLYAIQWDYTYYFLQILNGEYPVEDARADLRSLIGTKWDNRSVPEELPEPVT